MYAVYYDLETSDKATIGQILNYCFILVDDSLSIVDELTGLVRISRLQLPDSGAILANKIDVLAHQKEAIDTEREAMGKIHTFLQKAIYLAKSPVTLIGYNSARFDLNYLRTSFIRSGYNPYFGKNMPPGDLLHAVQKAYLTCPEFQRKILEERKGEPRLSLSLETVSHALKLLDGSQAHESRADVVLTIEVAKWLKEHAQIDVSTFENYEAVKLHPTARSGAVYYVDEPDYDLAAKSRSRKVPVTLLDCNYRYSLWIDLERFHDDQKERAILWRSTQKHPFFTNGQSVQDREWQEIARRALSFFKGTKLDGYFSRSTCDIEMDIYRIDPSQIDQLAHVIETGDRSALSELSEDAKKILGRYRLAHPSVGIETPGFAERLKGYAQYRYGGELQLAKKATDTRDQIKHLTLRELAATLEQNRVVARFEKRDGDVKLLDSLEQFYRGSEIAQVAGMELIPEWFRSAA